MLKLQHPHSMPHAVALHPPLNCLPSQSKLQQPLPSLAPSNMSYESHRLSTMSRAHLAVPSVIPAVHTTDMSSANGGYAPSHMRSNSRTADMLHGSTRAIKSEGQTYLNSSMQATSQRSSQASSISGPPSPDSQSTVQDSAHRRKSSIASQLQIPKTINTPQISLLQLAAEITCLFWFESSTTLQEILNSDPAKLNLTLSPEAIPSTGFKKWVAMILSTTQVAQNVILLALLFVYRLKKINPGVKGKSGSEYRLLTVALMLGNKFLDDNTYTNKTWAEVSGISVLEVHMMEVEFLQNMKYNLFTSEAEWREWHIILGKFGTFFDRASRPHLEVPPRTHGPTTPTAVQPAVPAGALPSPPSHYASPSYNRPAYSTTPLLLPQVPSATVSPIGPLPELDVRLDARKRSYEDSSVEPPAKRQNRQHTPSIASTTTTLAPSAMAPTLPRLPSLPSLSIPVSQNLEVPVQLVPQLPLPGNRAMSLVYPPPVQWSQPSSVPPLPVTSAPSSSPAPQVNGMHDQSRQLSPFPAGSVGNSPISGPYSAAGGQTQGRLSPSYLLSQRQSPYRPVRRVNTLLYPPPTTIMQNGPRSISWDQMQYQQLGRSERRAGPLPYMHHEAWPETNQFNQWPILPQPNVSRV